MVVPTFDAASFGNVRVCCSACQRAHHYASRTQLEGGSLARSEQFRAVGGGEHSLREIPTVRVPTHKSSTTQRTLGLASPPPPEATAIAVSPVAIIGSSTLPTAFPFPTLPPLAVPTYAYIPVPLAQVSVPNQVVIAFKPDTSQQQRDAYIASLGGTVKQNITALNSVVVEVPKQIKPASLPASNAVAASEPNYYVSAQMAMPPSDPYYDQQWALPAINAAEGWLALAANAPKVVVAVIDSGICANNPDLGRASIARLGFCRE